MRRLSSVRSLRRRSERGATAVVTALVVVVLVMCAAFTVDLGQQRVARADMQALADVVALDLARELDGRTVAQLEAAGITTSLAAASRARNDDVIGDDARVPTLTVRLGRLDDGSFTELTAPTDKPSAVRVVADTEVGFAFGGVTGAGSGGAARSAVAMSEGGACFGIGSYAAKLDTATSPILGPLLGALGSEVVLTAGNYDGLANVDVDLLEFLGVDLGAVTMEEVLEGSQLVGLGDFYLATADALTAGQTAQVQLLESIAAEVESARVRVSDLLNLSTGSASGLESSLNLLDLVTAAAAAATGEAGLTVDQTSVDLGPLAGVAVELSAIEAPARGCGRKNDPAATATSQAATVSLSLSALDLDIPGLLGTEVALDGEVRVVPAQGRLTDVRCAPAGANVMVTGGLLEVDLTLEVTVEATVLGFRIPVVSGPIRITGTTTAAGEAVFNIIEDADYDRAVSVGYDSSGMPDLSTSTAALTLIGLPVGILLDPILSALVDGLVDPLIESLDSALLTPLLRNLGIDLTGADVFLRRFPVCDAPRLVE